MNNHRKIAVISTGNGGQAMAAYFANMGFHVSLYAREQERVDMFENNIFTLDGVVQCQVKIDLISCNMQEVVEGAYLIMVTTPSQYHTVVAKEMAPFLTDGQTIVLNPGRTFGSYQFQSALTKNGCAADVTVAEADTLAFTCRCVKPGHPVIFSIKNDLNVAAIDQSRTDAVVGILRELFPVVNPSYSILHTGLSNIGMIFHPLPILMNITRVEAKEDFLYYKEGISPLVANVLERMDTERMAVADALGIKILSASDWLTDKYGSTGSSLYERLQSTDAYSTVTAPTDIDTRYIFEDVRTGCVPLSCLAKHIGVPTPIIDSVISWASTVYNYDFMANGRNDDVLDFRALVHDAHINREID